MPDPYAPKGWPRDVASETRSELDDFAMRLRQLGATPDEVQLVRDTWDELDPDDSDDPEAFTRARRAELVRKPDDELRAMIQAARDEYEVGTTTEAEADANEHQRAVAAAQQEAADGDVLAGSVPSVLEWVGDDLVRAEAVLGLEGSDGRKTLLEPLQAMLTKHDGE